MMRFMTGLASTALYFEADTRRRYCDARPAKRPAAIATARRFATLVNFALKMLFRLFDDTSRRDYDQPPERAHAISRTEHDAQKFIEAAALRCSISDEVWR